MMMVIVMAHVNINVAVTSGQGCQTNVTWISVGPVQMQDLLTRFVL